jgi:predicted acyltransferase
MEIIGGIDMANNSLPAQTSQRLLSLDALRGFTMFWIIGGDELVNRIAGYFKNPGFDRIKDFLTQHVDWAGFHFYDLIFPLFLFMAGVSIPFSIGRGLEHNESKRLLIIKVFIRTLLLFLLGWIYNGALEFKGFYHLRIPGVLQRIALGYCFAALAMLFFKARAQIVIGATLLLGYWAVMCWIPVPGFPAGTMTFEGNLAGYVDRLVFQPGQLWSGTADPEGLLSTLPALVTALLGMMAGQWLRSGGKQQRKVTGLLLGGVGCLVLGYIWSFWFPLIKQIWTSSFVLVAGGWSLMLLALFYWLIDVRGWKRWAFFLVVIGVNPITIYICQNFINFDGIAGYFVGGLLQFVPTVAPILFMVSALMVKWLFLAFLNRRKIYLRA